MQVYHQELAKQGETYRGPVLAIKWKALPESEKQKYEILYVELKQEFISQNELAIKKAFVGKNNGPDWKALRPREVQVYGTSAQYKEYGAYWNQIFLSHNLRA